MRNSILEVIIKIYSKIRKSGTIFVNHRISLESRVVIEINKEVHIHWDLLGNALKLSFLINFD